MSALSPTKRRTMCTPNHFLTANVYNGLSDNLSLSPLLSLPLSSSSIGYATPEGIAEANLQPHVRCLWLGGVQRSLDRGPKLTQLFNLVHPIQCALISRENGQEELAEERLTCGNYLPLPHLAISTCPLHLTALTEKTLCPLQVLVHEQTLYIFLPSLP